MAVPGRTEERSVAGWRARRGDHGGYRRAQAGARLRRSRLDDQADRLRPSPRARERALLATVLARIAAVRYSLLHGERARWSRLLRRQRPDRRRRPAAVRSRGGGEPADAVSRARDVS